MNFNLNDNLIELSIHSPTWAILFLLILIEILWISKFKMSFTYSVIISIIIRIQLWRALPSWWRVPFWSIAVFRVKDLDGLQRFAHVTCQNKLHKKTKTSTVIRINLFGKIKNLDTLLDEVSESDSKLTELIRDYKLREIL